MTKLKLPCIYRVHDTPSNEKFEKLKQIINVLDMGVQVKFTKQPKEFSNFVKKIKQNRFDDFIKMALLQTMEKARYDQENIGHFGLASNCYSHFTSPIRRYADLILHRMLHTFVFEKNLHSINHFKNILPTVAKQVSETEVKATNLERQVADIKKAEYMESFHNQILEGQIVSVLSFGFFVELNTNAHGLVRFASMEKEYFEIAKNGLEIKSKNYHFKIGDSVKVKIVNVNLLQGQIDLQLT